MQWSYLQNYAFRIDRYFFSDLIPVDLVGAKFSSGSVTWHFSRSVQPWVDPLTLVVQVDADEILSQSVQ